MSIIELANETKAETAFGSGVNKALAVEAKSVFEVKEAEAAFRKYAARVEKTAKAQLEMEKFSKMSYSNGGDTHDGTDATWTVINNQALVTFNSPYYISYGVKLTPKLVAQARSEPEAFMARYRKSIGKALAKQENIYIGSILSNDSTNVNYAGAATSDSELGTGSTMTVELFETMLDNMGENEYEPTDFFGTPKLIGQLRRAARLLNDGSFSVAIAEDGRTVSKVGAVEVHEIKGTDILPDFAIGTGSGTVGIMIDREGAFGICDFLEENGASPVKISIGKPDPTLEGANYHRILGKAQLQAQILDTNALQIVRVSKE